MSEISVIVPVYNKIRHIEDTVRCILDQTFEDFELLLIEDGSSDGTDVLCDELAELDKRVKLIHTENRGVSAARNAGIKASTGKYVSFIDADDSVDMTFLERLHTSIVSENADMSVCGYYEVRNGKVGIHLYRDLGTGCRLYDHIREDMLCILWNKLFVRDKIKHLFDEKLSTCEDSIFCVRYFLDNDPKIAVVNEALYEYTAHKGGLTSTYQENAFTGINKLLVMNRKLSSGIDDEHLRDLALHHIYKVYFYGVYTYIFGNLTKYLDRKKKLSVTEQVLNDRIYRWVIGYLFKKSDKDAEKNSLEEKLIIIFSILKMKRAICFIAKVKKCLGPLKNR